MVSTIKEIIWLCWLDCLVTLVTCKYESTSISSHATPMYCDNKSAIQIAHNSVFHEQTKHNEIDCRLTLHHFKHNTITLPFVSSLLHLANFFTKSHYVFHFRFLVDKLSMLIAVAS